LAEEKATHQTAE
jgi:chromosome segregation ATPase